MNMFVIQNDQFREYAKRISRHNLIQIVTPIILLFLFAFVSGKESISNEDPIIFGGILTDFIIVLYTGFRFKIYTTTSILSYLALVPIIGILLWVILFFVVGYFAILVFPFLMLYVGPSFNNTLARWFYNSTIEKFKARCNDDLNGLETSFSEVQKLETTLKSEQITPEIVNSMITNYFRNGKLEYSITSVFHYMSAAYIFIEKRGCFHVLKVHTNAIQYLSLTTVLSSESLDLDQTVKQMEELLKSN